MAHSNARARMLAAAVLTCAMIALGSVSDAAEAAAPGASTASATSPTSATSATSAAVAATDRDVAQPLSPQRQQLVKAWFALLGDGKPNLAAVAKQLEEHPELAAAWSVVDPEGYDTPMTALHLAASAENTALCQLLIDHHAPLDADDRWCSPPLMWCNAKMGAWLIARGARPTIFWYAQCDDAAAITKALAKDPALIKATDRQRVTALGHACDGGSVAAAQALLAAGADVRAVDAYEQTPLAHAVGWNDEAGTKPERQKVIDLLVAAGAPWDARAAALHGKLPELAAELDRHPELLKKHYGTESRDGSMLIHFACAGDHQDCVELLLKRGQDINALDDAGTTPLHNACIKGSTLVAWMLAHGANPNLREKRYGSDPKGWAQYFHNKGALAAFDAVAAATKDAAKAKAAEKATSNF